jgi:hypothetical protein
MRSTAQNVSGTEYYVLNSFSQLRGLSVRGRGEVFSVYHVQYFIGLSRLNISNNPGRHDCNIAAGLVMAARSHGLGWQPRATDAPMLLVSKLDLPSLTSI